MISSRTVFIACVILLICNFFIEEFQTIFLITTGSFFVVLIAYVVLRLFGFFKDKKVDHTKPIENVSDALAFATPDVKLQRRRDLSSHELPCEYEIARHANETLALRYGIANVRYHKQNRKIKIRKIRPLSDPNLYLVELSDFRKRKAIAVHIQGEPWIRTFLPIDIKNEIEDKSWYNKHEDLERVLKGNSTLTIQEIANYHVQRIAI